MTLTLRDFITPNYTPPNRVIIPRWRTITPASVTPVTLGEVKDHLNITDSDWDSKLRLFIAAAVSHAEYITGRAFCTQARRLSLDRFPWWNEVTYPRRSVIPLPGSPLQSISSIKYTPRSTSIETTLDSATYLTDAITEPGLAVLKFDQSWPGDELIEANGATVSYSCGYGIPDAVTVTVSVAAPGVISWASHGRQNGDVIQLSTTGALPTGLAAGTTYYATGITSTTTDTFSLAATRGGSAITTTGTQSGTHTVSLMDGRPTSMPVEICQAIMLHVGAMFAQREALTDASLTELPMGYDALIRKHAIEGFV